MYCYQLYTYVLLSIMLFLILLMYTHHQGTVQNALICIQNIGQNVTVMTGDFNCTFNPKYDRASQVESHMHSANLLRDLVNESVTDM